MLVVVLLLVSKKPTFLNTAGCVFHPMASLVFNSHRMSYRLTSVLKKSNVTKQSTSQFNPYCDLNNTITLANITGYQILLHVSKTETYTKTYTITYE